jgi:hypothetical protein
MKCLRASLDSARVTIRWRGEYNLQSECGPYRMSLAADAPTSRFWSSALR